MAQVSDEFGFEAAVALRLRTAPLRLVVMAAIAAMLWTIGRWPLAPGWFAAYAALQGVAALAGRRPSSGDGGSGRRLQYALATANFALAGAPTWHLWTRCGELGVAAAVMYLCGMLIQLIVGSLGDRPFFWFSAAPLIAYLLVLPPLAWSGERLTEGLAISACGLCLLAYLLALWSGHQKALERAEAARAEAIAARQEAERAAQAKGAFLATMSHEVRTPMNAVLGAAALLQRTPLDREQVEYAGMISNAGSVLMNVLNDVLDLSKIEAGKFDIVLARTDLGEVLRRCAGLWRQQAAARGLALEVEADPGLPEILLLDAERLSQILFNLLSNAVKFTASGAVGLKVEAQAPEAGVVWLTFTVTDTGSGIAPEALPRLFDAFEQADQSISRRFGGAGLGLAISQRLATLMGGGITVRSQLGRGSAFTLRLPSCQCETAAPAEDAPVRLDADAADADAGALRILIAEDNAMNRRIVEAFLSPLGAEITFAGDGAEALQALEAQSFDIVLMDIQMPLMDGVEATRRLRASGGPNADLPVIALTANVMEDQWATYRAAGMDAQVAKPIDAQQLLTAIAELARGRPRSARAASGAGG